MGIGEAARSRLKKQPRVTLFDTLMGLETFRKAGISNFVKVPIAPANADVMRKFSVQADPTYVFCAPDGQVVANLAGPNATQATLFRFLTGFKESYAQWLKTHPVKASGGSSSSPPAKSTSPATTTQAASGAAKAGAD